MDRNYYRWHYRAPADHWTDHIYEWEVKTWRFVQHRPLLGYDSRRFIATGQGRISCSDGKPLYRVSKDQFEGTILIDDAAFGLIPAPNLTPGKGGVGGLYQDADWERALRHGVGVEDRVLVGMPSEFFTAYGDTDLKALIAFLKTVPAVENELPQRELGPMAYLLIGTGMYKPPAMALDHEAAHNSAPKAAVDAAYGEYMVNLVACGECHGAALHGPEFEGPPPGPDLSPEGNLGEWTEDDFVLTLRSGTTLDGRILDSEIMPWPRMSRMSDLELRAIWRFLKTI